MRTDGGSSKLIVFHGARFDVCSSWQRYAKYDAVDGFRLLKEQTRMVLALIEQTRMVLGS